MKKKIITYFVLGALSVSMMTGCGANTTAKEVLTKMDSAVKKADSYQVNMNANVGLKLNINTNLSTDSTEESTTKTADSNTSISTPIKAKLNLKMDYDKKNKTDYNVKYDGKVEASLGGNSYQQDLKSYTTLAEDTFTQYIYVPDYDEWSKTTSDVTKDSSESMTDFALKISDRYSLARGTQTINHTKCYVLKASLDGKDFKDIYKELLTNVSSDKLNETTREELEAIPDKTLKNIKLESTIYVNQKNYYPVKCTFDFKNTNFNNLLKSALKSSEDASTAFSSLGIKADDLSIDNHKFFITAEYTKFNKGTDVTIPKDVIESASEDSSYDNSYDDSYDDSEDSNVDDDSESTSDIEAQYQELVKQIDAQYPKDYDKNTYSVESYTLAKNKVAYKVTNISKQPVEGNGAIRFYDASGALTDCSQESTDVLAPGQSVLLDYTTDYDYDTTSIGIDSDSSSYMGDPLDVTYTEKSLNDDSIVLNIKNNATKEADLKISLLLKKGDKPVDVVTKYVDEIPAGSSQDVSVPTDYSESFDHYELFLEGSVSKN